MIDCGRALVLFYLNLDGLPCDLSKLKDVMVNRDSVSSFLSRTETSRRSSLQCLALSLVYRELSLWIGHR